MPFVLAAVLPFAAACAAPARIQLEYDPKLVELDSPYGHDAFLVESEALAPVLRHALRTEEVTP